MIADYKLNVVTNNCTDIKHYIVVFIVVTTRRVAHHHSSCHDY